MDLTDPERNVLTVLQRGIDLVERPFSALALPEPAVLDLLRRARTAGVIRRFGGVFDARRLGYQSVLCAVDADPPAMNDLAAIVAAHPGVTHCYERRPFPESTHYPALWFTLALPHERFDDGLAALRRKLHPHAFLQLPAVRRFKIDVVFDLRTRERDETFPGSAAPSFHGAVSPSSPAPLTDADRDLVRLLDGDVPLCARPFEALADELGMPVSSLLARLRDWSRQGVLRRIGIVLYHRRAGFTANGMCVWPVNGDIPAAGRRVAARPEVTHCYQRPRREGFPFDLYAMIHNGRPSDTRALFEELSDACALPDGEVFLSYREFKKTSMRYFAQ